jgi:hypothetical protein
MIVNKNIPSTGSTILQSQPGQSLAVTTVFFCNIDANMTDNLNVYVVQAGTSTSNSNMIINTQQIPATDTFVLDAEKLILENGDSLVAKSLNGVIVATCSYMDIT